jgi:hypothetical protein
MPSVRIPLVGSMNQRGPITGPAFVSGKDQRFINCLLDVVDNKIANSRTVYVQKRPGLESYSTPSSGNAGYGVYVSPAEAVALSVFSTSYTVFWGTTNCGNLGAVPVSISEAVFNAVTYILISTTSGAFFLPVDAVSVSTTFTGDTTNASAVVTNVSSTSGLYVGQAVSGTGIPASTRIKSIDSSSQITLTANATATNATVTITREHIAKIIDADFPSTSRGLCELDGRLFSGDEKGNVYQSSLNTPVTWAANEYIPSSVSTDRGQGVARYKNLILSLGAGSLEFYRNSGNPSNSTLSRVDELGCLTGSSGNFAQANDLFFFIGPVVRTPGVFILDGFTPRKISTPYIDRAVSTSGFFSTTISAFYHGGYTYCLVYAQNGQHFLYCAELDSWLEQSFPSDDLRAANQRLVDNNSGPLFVMGGTSGKVFVWDQSPVYQDNGSAYTMTIQLARQDFGTGNRKFLKSIELVADQQASGTTTLEISKDDFATWTTIGTFDMTKAKKIIHRCGSFVGGASLRLTHSANTAWRGEALIVEYDVGAH